MNRTNLILAVLVPLLYLCCATVAKPGTVMVPEIDGAWWRVAGNPDLGDYTTAGQQPVDFAVWQAHDGTWQLSSCIRKTNCGGNTRLFHRWQGRNLTDTDWKPMGIAMEADTTLGEQKGGLQAPHVIKVADTYYMFYGDWQRICLAKSADGKNFTRVLNESGQPDLFTGPWENMRDPMVLPHNGKYYCYYMGHLNGEKQIGAIFARVSTDLKTWSPPPIVAYGGRAGNYRWSAECPHVIYRPEEKLFYLFRTQRYGPNNITSIYASPDPLDFGINDDKYFVTTLPVAAPEIIQYKDQYYIAALLPNIKGIRIAKLKWTPIEE